MLIKIFHVVEDKLECKTRNKNIMIMEVNLSEAFSEASFTLSCLCISNTLCGSALSEKHAASITCRNTMCFGQRPRVGMHCCGSNFELQVGA